MFAEIEKSEKVDIEILYFKWDVDFETVICKGQVSDRYRNINCKGQVSDRYRNINMVRLKNAIIIFDENNDPVDIPLKDDFLLNEYQCTFENIEFCEYCKELCLDDIGLTESGACQDCWNSDYENASTVIEYGPEGKENYKIGDFVCVNQYGDDDDSILEFFDRPRYVKTDGWRGHHVIDKKEDSGLIEICSGWITGYPDDTVGYKRTALNLSNKIKDIHNKGGCISFTIFWTFCLTSNCFSQISDIFIPESDKEIFMKWLKSQGIDIEKLQRAFE